MRTAGWKKALAVCLAVALIWIFAGCGSGEEDHRIAMPMSASEMRSRHYEDVVTKLREVGFINVCAQPMNDLVLGWLKKDGSVDEVSADGERNFKKNERFDPDVYIIIRYHSFAGSEESTTPEDSGGEPVIADTSDGMTGLPICSDDIRDLSVKQVVDALTQAGFVNIKTEPLGDLVVGLLHSDGQISEVSVGGDIRYKKGDRYYPDVKIVIRYHSY